MVSQRLQTSSQGDMDSSSVASNNGVGGSLSQGALYEILLRVPAWALCRFRTVCRSWHSLLSGPPFIAAHAAHHRNREPLFAVCGVAAGGGSHGTGVCDINLLDASGRVMKRVGTGPSSLLRRIHPQPDLVLIHRGVGEDHHPLRVLDPATGVAVPLPGYHDGYSTCVFGRAESSTGGDGEYKVLSLSRATIDDPPYDDTQLCEVLTIDMSSGSGGTWRAAPGPPVAIKTLHRDTLVASGMVYHLVDSTVGWSIAAFDLKAEQWRPDLLHGPTPPAPSIGGWAVDRSLAVVNDRLAAVSSTYSALDMWLLMGSDEKAQWCQQCRVVTSSIERGYWFVGADAEPLWVLDDGRVALWLRSCLSRYSMLWMYDPRTQICTHLADCSIIGGVGVYTGNLLRHV